MIIACLLGIFLLLVTTEYLGRHKILPGEYQRKFLHITSGTFIVFWPWLISWSAIRGLAVAMLLVMVIGRYTKQLSYNGRVRRVTYGDIFLVAAILICSFISPNKIFFALAILEVALADGLAAVIGMAYGRHWQYRVFGYKKTLVGSMMFWIVSAVILAAGLLLANAIFQPRKYYESVLFLPPALTVVEMPSIYGIDNLLVPVITVWTLRLFLS